MILQLSRLTFLDLLFLDTHVNMSTSLSGEELCPFSPLDLPIAVVVVRAVLVNIVGCDVVIQNMPRGE